MKEHYKLTLEFAHEADESYQATTSYLGDVQRPIRHRLIDYENLPESIDSYVYGIDNSITRRQWRDIHHILDEEGYIHDMNDGGRRIMELQGFETPFNRSINPNIPERIFTDGEMIPVLVDGPGYAYHRDTLQLLGFFTPQGQLRIITDIRPRININQLRRHQRNNLPIPLPIRQTPPIQPQETDDEIEGIVGRDGDAITYPTQTLETNNERIRIEYNRVRFTSEQDPDRYIYIFREIRFDERGGRSTSTWEVEGGNLLNEIERIIEELNIWPNGRPDGMRRDGMRGMGLIQIYTLLAEYSSYEPDRRYNDHAFRDTNDAEYNEMVRRMLSDDYDDNFRFNFIITDSNNRAYYSNNTQYLGEIHNLRRLRTDDPNIQELVTINRNTIRYL